MIEQYVSNKLCTKCKRYQPVTQFNRAKVRRDGVQPLASHCKDCHRVSALAHYHAHKHEKKPPREKVTAWMIPADPRPISQQLLAATQRRWRYECEPAANLIASIGVAA